MWVKSTSWIHDFYFKQKNEFDSVPPKSLKVPEYYTIFNHEFVCKVGVISSNKKDISILYNISDKQQINQNKSIYIFKKMS